MFQIEGLCQGTMVFREALCLSVYLAMNVPCVGFRKNYASSFVSLCRRVVDIGWYLTHQSMQKDVSYASVLDSILTSSTSMSYFVLAPKMSCQSTESNEVCLPGWYYMELIS